MIDALTTDLLWRYAVALVPLAALVALVAIVMVYFSNLFFD